MERRAFSGKMLQTITGVAFLDTLFKHDLLAHNVRPIAERWLKELHTMCSDLKTNRIQPLEWQRQINAFHQKLPLEDLIQLIDFENAIKSFEYPDLGVVTKDPPFPTIEGISERYAFIGRIFGMKKERAIIPHGHKNMVSCHRVLKGEFLLKQYDRLRDEGEYMFVRQTIEEEGKPGSFSSISEQKNNVHWLRATTEKAYTFDVIVVGLNEKDTEIDNIDISNAEKVNSDLLKVKKLYWKDALNKYGKSHH